MSALSSVSLEKKTSSSSRGAIEAAASTEVVVTTNKVARQPNMASEHGEDASIIPWRQRKLLLAERIELISRNLYGWSQR